MDRLFGMEVFVRVVELGGFTPAAAESAISTTMVSNHIKALEQRLGAKLLNRTTRRQSLSEIGARYYAQCLDVLARIEAAESEAREMRSRPRGRLKVSAPVTLGCRVSGGKSANSGLELGIVDPFPPDVDEIPSPVAAYEPGRADREVVLRFAFARGVPALQD